MDLHEGIASSFGSHTEVLFAASQAPYGVWIHGSSKNKIIFLMIIFTEINCTSLYDLCITSYMIKHLYYKVEFFLYIGAKEDMWYLKN